MHAPTLVATNRRAAVEVVMRSSCIQVVGCGRVAFAQNGASGCLLPHADVTQELELALEEVPPCTCMRQELS